MSSRACAEHRLEGIVSKLAKSPYRSGGNSFYAGPAFIALGHDARAELEARLAKLAQEEPALTWLKNRNARWVRPELTLKVKHLAGGPTA